MNSNAVLALMGDLYAQIAALTESNDALMKQLEAMQATTAEPTP